MSASPAIHTDTMPSSRPKLYLIDGSGFIFRAYHTAPPLTNAAGTPVGAVYIYTNMLMKLVQDHKADYMAVIFDAARKTFRDDIYAEYKANRPPAPEDLVPQFPLVRDATRALNIPAIELEGYEADDLIASYAKEAEKAGMDVVIISSDKDLMQLINDHVTMFDAMKNKSISYEQVKDKFGVTPDKVIEVQALIGDSTDNIPGVPGIGPKTAAELIDTYGDLESVLQRAGEIKQNKRREMLIEHADQARLSYKLVTLDDATPLPMPITEMTVKDVDEAQFIPFLQEHRFKSILAKFGATVQEVPRHVPAGAPEAVECTYALVQDEVTLKEWIAKAHYAGKVAFDVETDSLNPMQAKLVGFSLSVTSGEACYVPLQHGSSEAQGDLLGSDDTANDVPDQLPLDRALALITPLLEASDVLKIGHNIKFDMLVMRQHGVTVTPVDDSMLLSYALDSVAHRHNMDALSELHLGVTPVPFSEAVDKSKGRKTFADVPLDEACDYAAEDADITLRLYDLLVPRLVSEKRLTFYERVERPLIPVLVQMEHAGVRVDPKTLKDMSADFAKRLDVLAGEIYALAGREFTIGSPKQLGEILFDELGFEGGKKGKSGSYGTGADILEGLADEGHELPGKVLEWRQLSKLKSTYTDALQQQIHPGTGRVHTSFSMAVTSTGRLSSNDPNLQNIPIRTEEGRKIRTAFVADPGNVIIAADYSQIELRLLAHMAGIESLLDAFRHDKDIHAITAHQVFDVPLEEVDSELRRRAKMINFGIIYGMSAFGLSNRLGIGRKEAAEYIDAYFTQYPGIRKYMDRVKAFAAEHGYVPTLLGRKCHIRGIKDKNANMRNMAERQAINAPMQGTAADIMKKAMIAVQCALEAVDLPRAMLLQVHDELLFEVPEARAEEVSALAKRAMESVIQLDVPLVVEVGTGANWGEAH